MAKRRKQKPVNVSFRFLCFVVVLCIVAFLVYKYYYLPYLAPQTELSEELSVNESEEESEEASEEESEEASEEASVEHSHVEKETVVSADLSIHFLELGNKYTGDCTLIKVGDTEVLIDAGSRQNSAPTILSYINEYCTDGVLEYVIATHAHQDHIAGFVGQSNKGKYNGVLYSMKVGTLIQFALSDQSETTDTGGRSLYGKYVDAVGYAESQGTKVLTALQCVNGTDGGQQEYVLNQAETVKMRILYNYYYDHSAAKTDGEENNYSVCMLLSDSENNYLFTGDLEAEGESYLVDNNTLPHCKLFKGGHHGSYTASSKKLLEVIEPEIVCVCCCCGSTEYTKNIENVFPSQAFCDRVFQYTTAVYVTSIISSDGSKGESLNGNIVVYAVNGEVFVDCSNNNTVFKDTEWFKKYRTYGKE